MSTYREVAYLILDEVKINSDDSYFEIEHVLFLMTKYRSLLLKQRYGDIRKNISISNYQTICLDLEKTETIDSYPCDKPYLKSI